MNLPVELIQNILYHIGPIREVGKCAAVCVQWRGALDGILADAIWENATKQTFPPTISVMQDVHIRIASKSGTGAARRTWREFARQCLVQPRLDPGGTIDVAVVAGGPRLRDYKDGPALDARFSFITSIVCRNGDYIVTDPDHRCLRWIGRDGQVHTLAGARGPPQTIDGPGPLARFCSPGYVCMDANGDVFVNDVVDIVVRKVTFVSEPTLEKPVPDVIVTTVAGKSGRQGYRDGPAGDAEFLLLNALAVDTNGVDILLCDPANHVLRKLNVASNTISTVAGIPGDQGDKDGKALGEARLAGPNSLAVAHDGAIFIGDFDFENLRMLSADRQVVVTIERKIPAIDRLLLTQHGQLIVLSSDGPRLVSSNPQTPQSALLKFNGRAAGFSGATVDDDGCILVTDFDEYVVKRLIVPR